MAAAFTDEEIVARIRSGELELYETIMRRYNQRLYRVARAILKDEIDVEDVVQESYVRAYHHLDQYAGDARFSTWLTRIVINEALARRRRKDIFEELPGSDQSGVQTMARFPSPAPSPEAAALHTELRAVLESAIDALPELYRTVFVLREVEQMSTAETAECLNVTTETVKIRLHRSRALLREGLMTIAGAASPRAFEFQGERCDRICAAVMTLIRNGE